MSASTNAGRASACALSLLIGCSEGATPYVEPVDGGKRIDATVWPPPDAGPPKVDADLDYELRQDGGTRGEPLCDGLDNDHDGLIDNVDFANDGICDCLMIATLGSSLHGGDETLIAWLARRGGGVIELGSQELTAEALAPHQVLIVQDVRERAYSANEIATLEKWVHAGGGLFTMTGYTADLSANVNALLAPFGLHYGALLVLVNPLANVSVPVNTWHSDPVTEGITSVGVVSAYEVQGEGKVLAEGDDLLLGKQVMLRSVEHGAGKVLAWGDEWITYNSEWVARTDYQVARLWSNALQWLGGEKECKVPPPILI